MFFVSFPIAWMAQTHDHTMSVTLTITACSLQPGYMQSKFAFLRCDTCKLQGTDTCKLKDKICSEYGDICSEKNVTSTFLIGNEYLAYRAVCDFYSSRTPTFIRLHFTQIRFNNGHQLSLCIQGIR